MSSITAFTEVGGKRCLYHQNFGDHYLSSACKLEANISSVTRKSFSFVDVGEFVGVDVLVDVDSFDILHAFL